MAMQGRLGDTAGTDDEAVSERSPLSKPRRFSMLRDFTLADVITLANGMAGTGSILSSLKFLESGDRNALWHAVLLLPLAVVFDYFDGQVARWRRRNTPLGAQLDSLADLISFGVAPAALAFAAGMRGGWDALALVYFVSCGLSRLARYNVTAAALSDDSGKVRYYEGTPIPTSVALVAVMGVLLYQGKTGARLPFGTVELGPWVLHPLVLMFVLSGSAMISKTLRIPKP
jgi:CDP-diacylglycerol--serine O-phosphatidyltransferase